LAEKFSATLEGVEGSSATFVRVPSKIVQALGGRIRVPVRILINAVEHRTTMCNMGMGPMIGVPAALRTAARIERGRRITIAVEVDTKERTVDLPADFAKSMSDAERRTYDALAYTHRKEYVQWIEGAKKPDTRARRIAQAREKLRLNRRG